MEIELYQSVRLITDKYAGEGLTKGMIGTILERYDDENYEVEWYDAAGNTVTFFAFHVKDFEVIQD